MTGLNTTELCQRDERDALAISLQQVLEHLLTAVGPVSWRVFELEAVGDGTIDLADVVDLVERSPSGHSMTTEQLVTLAASLNQVINAIIAVVGSEQPPEPPPVGVDFYRCCRLTLECIDGDVWKITSAEPAVHASLRALLE